MKSAPMFVPQMTRDEAVQLSKEYSYALDYAAALAAGKAIKAGDHSRANLEAIYFWKTKGRGKSRLHKNSDKEIRDALRLAVSA